MEPPGSTVKRLDPKHLDPQMMQPLSGIGILKEHKLQRRAVDGKIRITRALLVWLRIE
jgi:hypothetical protein